jgi:hypothetical protein
MKTEGTEKGGDVPPNGCVYCCFTVVGSAIHRRQASAITKRLTGMQNRRRAAAQMTRGTLELAFIMGSQQN